MTEQKHTLPAPSEESPAAKKEETALLSLISTPKKTEDMVRYAIENGAGSALFINASGTIPGSLLSLLGLSSVKRSLAVLTVPRARAAFLLKDLEERFTLNRKMGGIAWIQNFYSRTSTAETEYAMILAVVNEGEGKYVVEQARSRHKVGASILKATGSANHTKKTFHFEITPAKEIVTIISKIDQCRNIYETIYEALRTEKPGRGMIFSTLLDGVSGVMPFEHSEGDSGQHKTLPRTENERSRPLPIQNNVSVHEQPAENEFSPDIRHVGLIAVVHRGHAGAVVAAAEQAGGRGATILHGRETASSSGHWFDIIAQAEREAVMIIAPEKTARDIARMLDALHASQAIDDLRLFAFHVRQFRLFSYGTK